VPSQGTVCATGNVCHWHAPNARIGRMKLRDSGMPEEEYWESLFDVPLILSALGIDFRTNDVAELGCGYGTFSIPVAKAIRRTLYTFDIEQDMLTRTAVRAEHAGLANVVVQHRDVMAQGFDVPRPVDAVLLFNILHCEQPERLLGHAIEALKPGGKVLVIHWRCDRQTPRGPSLEIRPKPETIVAWAEATGRLVASGGVLDLPPWHFGLVFERP
jgi:SAM-dependent methyltransferase